MPKLREKISDHDGKDISVEEFENKVSGSYQPLILSDQIIEFGKILTGIEIYGYQYLIAFRIIHSVLTNDGEAITMLLSRQSGKSEVLSFTASTLLVITPILAKIFPELAHLKDGIMIGLFAPQKDQVETTYGRTRSRIQSKNAQMIMADPEIAVELTSRVHINLTNGSFMTGQVANKQSKIESKTFHIVIIEEAQDVDSYLVEKSIEPMVAACVCGDSLIYDSYGVRHKIKDYFGNSIVGYNEETKKIESDSVTWLPQRSQVKECYRVELASGHFIECSYDHPILVRERKGGMYGRKLHWIETKDLIEGLHVAVPDKVDIFRGVNEMFDPRLLGMLIGDGSYRKEGMVRYCSCDKELLDYVKDSYDFKVYNTYTTNDGRTFEDGTLKGLCASLRDLGIYGQVGEEKTLPSNIDSYTKETVCELIGGLYDTDGCVTHDSERRGCIDLTQSSEKLIDEVKSLLVKFGVHSKKSKILPSASSLGTKEYYRLYISDKVSIERFYDNFTLLVEYKQNKLEALVKILSTRKSKTDKNHPNLRFDRVVKVVKIGDKEVFNLTANNNHTYIANNIVTHNTNGIIIRCGTTGRTKNHFWEEIQYNKILNRKVKDERLAFHYEFDYKSILKYKREQYAKDKNPFHLNYEKTINRLIAKRGEDDTTFVLNYALRWSLDDGMFFTKKSFNKLCDKRRGETKEFSDNTTVCAGLDIAKDHASTVLTIGESEEVNLPDGDIDIRKKVGLWAEISNADYEQQHHILVDYLLYHRVDVLYADYTGVGKAVVDRLLFELGDKMLIIPYTFTRPSKSDMWLCLDADTKGGRLSFPANKKIKETQEFKNFEEQMLNLQKDYQGSYMIAQKSMGYKDDYCDSLGLFCLACENPEPEEAEEDFDNPFYEGRVGRQEILKSSSW